LSYERRRERVTVPVSLHESERAWELLRDPSFIAAWRRLHALAEGATAFQAPEFVATWYRHYESDFIPWLLAHNTPDGDLRGLLTLAYNPRDSALIVAGGHQAEYQGWLARAGEAGAFLAQAWRTIADRVPTAALNFKYLPAALLRGAGVPSALRGLVELRARRRPLMRLMPERIEESLRKKGNKSKLNRLARVGEVRLERLRTAQALEAYFDEIIAYYDVRQGAMHDACPFRSDAHKRAFHLAWAEHSDSLHVTVLTVGGRLAAAHLGAITDGTVHLGIIAHSPQYAEHSVGKLQVLLLARHLAEEGFETFDLTPGDDPWKERFADAHDEVYELGLYRDRLARLRATAPDRAMAAVKRGAAIFGVTPERLRGWRARWRAPVAAAPSAMESSECWRRDDPLTAVVSGGGVTRGAVGDLVLMPDGPQSPARRQYLTEALARLERKEHVYTETRAGKLRYCAWSRRAEDPTGGNAALLYDIQGLDDAAVDALFEQNLAMLETPALVQIPAAAGNLARVLDRLGFERTSMERAPASGAVGADAESSDS
jgi:CelD/BcsL family acetyltransferase involved in cellulose biosynthesis